MGARLDLAVALFRSDDPGDGNIVITYDEDAGEDLAVDVKSGTERLFSCSLNDVEEFAALLGEFVQHHRDRLAETEDGEE